MSVQIDPRRVTEIYAECQSRSGEVLSGHVSAEGIVTNAKFDPTRLRDHTAEINALLDRLPAEFRKSHYGGMSFLMAFHDRCGVQWASDDAVVEQLLLLGIATGKVEHLTPRVLWSTLYGGMPYFVIND